MTLSALDVRDAEVRFHGVPVLRDFNLSLNQGELCVLLGPSGCGKTTVLRLIAGLIAPDRGRVIVHGADITSLPTHKRNVGMVFQSYSLFPHMTAAQNVAFGLTLRKGGRQRQAERVREMLGLVGLAEKAEAYPHELSGGQQQRIALARALILEPTLLLLDEPLSALDAQVRLGMREEVQRIQRELGITTVFVTHDQEEALAIADRIGVMRQGKLEQLGTPREIYQNPANEFVADFVGFTNRILGVVGVNSVTVWESTRPIFTTDSLHPDQPVRVLVRPEQILLQPALDANVAGPVATVKHVSFLGSLQRIWVATENGEQLLVQCGHEQQLTVGQPVRLVLTDQPLTVQAQTEPALKVQPNLTAPNTSASNL